VWSLLMSKPVVPSVQESECLSLVPDARGVFPPQLRLVCQLDVNNKNVFHFQSGQHSSFSLSLCLYLSVCLSVCLVVFVCLCL